MRAGDRNKAAYLNSNFETLKREFNKKGEQINNITINKNLFEKIMALSYMDIGQQDNGSDKQDNSSGKIDVSGLYEIVINQKKVRKGEIYNKLCGDCKDIVKVDEFFDVKNVHLKRSLPLVTGFLMQNGIENMNTGGKPYQYLIDYVAMFVFEIDITLDEKEKWSVWDKLFKRAITEKKKRQVDSANVEDKNEEIGLINEYIEMIKEYFPKYVKGKDKTLETEGQYICSRIQIELSKRDDARY